MRGLGKNRKTDQFIELAFAMETDDCILWPYGLMGGYPMIKRNGQNIRVTKLVCEQFRGSPPMPKPDVAHNCHRPQCINKRHLRWDTRKGNLADMLAQGTSRRGHNSPLTAEQVREIRNLSDHKLQKEIAAQFGISNQTACSIINRKTWGWLP